MRRVLAVFVLVGLALCGPMTQAAPTIVPRFNAYFASAFTDAAYQKAAAAKVLKGWKPALGPAVGKKTVLIALIARDGALTGLRDHLMTGSKGWDDAAIAAVKGSAPFAPLPASYPHSSLEVHFHFEAAAK